MSNASTVLSDRPLVAPALLGLDSLTPAQQLALLIITKSDIAEAVLRALTQSTVRPSRQDYAPLVAMQLAARRTDGFHVATPRGRYTGNILARDFAAQLGLKVTNNSGLTRRSYGSCTTAQFSA